jgi:hypothetical protein
LRRKKEKREGSEKSRRSNARMKGKWRIDVLKR